jgi:MFS-type transporter involved in bile tolerance (Atg22 family)
MAQTWVSRSLYQIYGAAGAFLSRWLMGFVFALAQSVRLGDASNNTQNNMNE